MQTKFESMFHQLDHDLGNVALYDSLYQLGHNLNDQFQKNQQFLMQQNKILRLQQGDCNIKKIMRKCLCGDIEIRYMHCSTPKDNIFTTKTV